MLANLKIITPVSKHCDEISHLLLESIQVNCAADYNHDEAVINAWVSNKTPENINHWIHSENNVPLADYDANTNQLAGFALFTIHGEILLNYVLPAYLYKGVGKRLLNEIERIARSKGVKSLVVVSTITAKKFYTRNGFVQNGEPEYVGNILGDFPLIKHLNQ
ncbi:MAG: GNAT family N-acetyltransferase [Legionellaceae bacterium]|nr:GNAT family N-acetyltransferase [Legionellaceae bacterium]